MSVRKLRGMNAFFGSRDALKQSVWVYAQSSPVTARTPFNLYLSVLALGTRPIFSEASWIQKLRPLFERFNARLTVLSSLFARQCHAIAAQRVRRAAQIVALYGNLGYDRRSLQTVVSRVGTAVLRRIGDRPRHLLWGLAIFAWERETISDEEISRYTVYDSCDSSRVDSYRYAYRCIAIAVNMELSLLTGYFFVDNYSVRSAI